MRLSYKKLLDAGRLIVGAVGEDCERGGLAKTPERFAKAMAASLAGYDSSDEEVRTMLTIFDSEAYDQMVVLKRIEFYSMCEHHLMPFFGQATVAYIPNENVVGISKLARLVDIYARRLQLQERLTGQVADALMVHLKPKGAACYIEAVHLCMRARGVEKQNSEMITSSLKGVFLEDHSAREEFLHMARSGS